MLERYGSKNKIIAVCFIILCMFCNGCSRLLLSYGTYYEHSAEILQPRQTDQDILLPIKLISDDKPEEKWISVPIDLLIKRCSIGKIPSTCNDISLTRLAIHNGKIPGDLLLSSKPIVLKLVKSENEIIKLLPVSKTTACIVTKEEHSIFILNPGLTDPNMVVNCKYWGRMDMRRLYSYPVIVLAMPGALLLDAGAIAIALPLFAILQPDFR